jgi:transmembrane sensor
MSSSNFSVQASRKLLDYALLLIARQHGGDDATAASARDEFSRWRSAAPAHEMAAQAALRGWAATEAQALQDSIPLPAAQHAGTAQTRRRIVSALGVAGLVAALGGTGRWVWQQPLQQLALKTERGQLLSRPLEDGSQLDLAPNTTAQATLYRNRREVRLVQGEIRFNVAHDASKPFVVQTTWGHVRVLGTVFTVDVRPQYMDVAVAEGRVAVWATRQGASAGNGDGNGEGPPDERLSAGQSLRVYADGRMLPRQVKPEDVAAWRQGWLVFDQTPLAEAVSRWNDYVAQPMVLADDAALGALHITGSFRVREPESFVSSLPKVLPVRVDRVERADRAGGSTISVQRR